MKKSFISYPKSGRTWIRFILVELGVSKKIHFHHDTFEFNDGAKPKLNFEIDERIKKYSVNDKIIYLERDPKDVMVSLYHQITGRFKDFFKYEGSISDFIRDDYFGAENLAKFRYIWNTVVKQKSFLKITYEECHDDLSAVIIKILNYYELEIDKNKIEEAVKKASFDNMKNIERSQSFSQPWLRPRNNAYKVREGKVGSYKNYLSKKDIEYLSTIFGKDV